jgi:RNA polymerase sigma-70 factor (ECF subfamily)
MIVAAVAKEAEALAAYRAGDSRAFEEIYDRHARPVLTYLVGMLGDREAAEDTLQGIFTSFAARARELDAGTNVRAYLLASARNAVVNLIRARGRRERFAEGYEVLVRRRATEFDPPERNSQRDELRARLNRALGELPDPEREVVLLHCQAEMTFEEVARVLGIPRGTATTRYRSALVKLRMRLRHE